MMPRRLLWQKDSDPICHPQGRNDDPQREETIPDLFSQLETNDFRSKYFKAGKKSLRQGQPMRAIQDFCYAFNFEAIVSRSGRYIEFVHPALRFLRIPATTSTKIVVKDQQDDSRKAHFDIRLGSYGMHDLMRWLVQKSKGSGITASRPQLKPYRCPRSKAGKGSPVRQRLVVQVLIRNAEKVEEDLMQESIGLD